MDEVLAMAIGAYVDGKYRNVYDTGLVTARGAPVYVCIDRGHECVVYTTRVMKKRIGRTHTSDHYLRYREGRKRTKYRLVVIRDGLVVGDKIIHTTGFHTLVCYAFHGPPPEPNMEVDHIDFNPGNNHPSNLRWLNVTENRKRKRFDVIAMNARQQWERYSPETKALRIQQLNNGVRLAKLRRGRPKDPLNLP